MGSRPRALTIGHRFATGAPRSLWWRGLGVFDQGIVNAARRAGIGARSKKARRGRSRAGERGLRERLLGDAVNSGAVLALLGIHGQSHLLPQGPADEAADAVRLMPMSA
jgi:hypothetical protein